MTGTLRNTQVYKAACFEKPASGLMRRLGHSHNGGVYVVAPQHFVYDRHGCHIGVYGILTALEHTGVAALKA